jgi:drug/metabolite transporter (DMT)-like permease
LGFSALQLSLMSLFLEPHPISTLGPIVLASIFTPIFGIFLGGVLLQKPFTVKLLVGGGLVTGGMALVN